MADPGWVLRRDLPEAFTPNDVYGIYPTLFAVRMNHGGVFTSLHGRRYENGNIDYVDLVNSEGLSINEFHLMLNALGYNRLETKFYHFLIPETDLDTGLRPLGNNQDVLTLLQYAPVVQVIDVFVEHGMSNIPIPPESMNNVIHSFDPFLGLGSELPLQGVDVNFQHSNHMNNGIHLNQETDLINAIDLNHQIEYDNGIDLNQESHNHDHIESHNSNDYDEGYGFDEDFDDDNSNSSGDWFGENESQNVVGDVEPVDLDNFESGDEIGSLCKGRANAQDKLVDFYLGQTFGSKANIISLIKQHSIETRRDLVVVRNDLRRIRVVCRGQVPNMKEISGPGKGRKAV